MNIKKIILFSLVLLPIIEIFLFVEIGSIIGSFNTISIIILSAFFGIYLIKTHAPRYLAEMQSKVIQGIRPDKEIMSGIITLISGIFFFIPGFLTDFIGIFMLIAPVKSTLINKYGFTSTRTQRPPRKSVIDVEHREDD
tara:strand:- start:371 stop:787 length:417 start_codon:yes stop_codon:yes gene_type:complete